MKQRLSQVSVRSALWAVIISAAGVLLVIGAVAAVRAGDGTIALGAEATTTAGPVSDDPREFASSRDTQGRVADHTPMATGGSPSPNVAQAVAADGGVRLALGEVLVVPGSVELDFLFEFCWPECFRDGHFMDPAGSGLGSGPFTAGVPFHVRHGFPVDGPEPLGDGFDVVIYVTPLDEPGEFGGEEIAETSFVLTEATPRVHEEHDGAQPIALDQIVIDHLRPARTLRLRALRVAIAREIDQHEAWATGFNLKKIDGLSFSRRLANLRQPFVID